MFLGAKAVSAGDIPAAPNFAFTVNSVDHSIAAYRIDPVSRLLQPNGHWPLGRLPTSVAVHPRAPFVYACTTANDAIAIYRIGDDGRLAAIASSPVKGVGRAPTDLVFTPDGRFLYATLRHAHAVAAFAVDAASGAITPVAGSPFATHQLRPRTLAMHPGGRFIYTPNEHSNSISAFRIDPATGVLSQVEGSPFATGDEGILNEDVLKMFDLPATAGGVPFTVTVHPSGRFVYVANRAGGSLSMFRADEASGALTPLDGSPMRTGQLPYSVVAHPSGRFVYVTSFVDAAVWGYAVHPVTGALAVLPDAPYATRGDGPLSLTFSPAGDIAYVANSQTSSNSIAVFTVDAASGTLTLRDTVQTRSAPHAIALYSGPAKSARPALHVVDATAGRLHRYDIDAASRELKPVAQTAISRETSAVVADANGEYVFAIQPLDATLVALRFDAETGRWQALAGSPYTVGKRPRAVEVDRNGRYVYVTNESSNDVYIFLIDRTAGVLQLAAIVPIGGARQPALLTVDAAVRYAFVGNEESGDISVFRYRESDSPLMYEITSLGSPFALGKAPFALRLDPSGKFLFATVADALRVFSVHPQSGMLTAMNDKVLATGREPRALAIHPGGRFVYVLNQADGTIGLYARDTDTGVIREHLPRMPAQRGAFRMVMEASGKFVYVFAENSPRVQIFGIDASSGRLAKAVEFSLAHPVTAVAEP